MIKSERPQTSNDVIVFWNLTIRRNVTNYSINICLFYFYDIIRVDESGAVWLAMRVRKCVGNFKKNMQPDTCITWYLLFQFCTPGILRVFTNNGKYTKQ